MMSTIKGPIEPIDMGLNPTRVFIFRSHRTNTYGDSHRPGKRKLTKWHMAYSIPHAALFTDIEVRVKTICKRDILVDFGSTFKVVGIRKHHLPAVQELFRETKISCMDCLAEYQKQVFKRHLTEERQEGMKI